MDKKNIELDKFFFGHISIICFFDSKNYVLSALKTSKIEFTSSLPYKQIKFLYNWNIHNIYEKSLEVDEIDFSQPINFPEHVFSQDNKNCTR